MLESILEACQNELNNGHDVPINVPLNRLDKIVSLIDKDSSITIDQLA